MLEKITESLYAHTQGKTIGNVGLIATRKGNFVIDTSMFPKMVREIRTEVEGIGTGKVAAAIWTHYHLDHSGGSQVFHDVPVYAHRAAANNYNTNYPTEKLAEMLSNQPDDRKALMEGLVHTKPTKVYETTPYYIDENDSIVIHKVGGHTNGSVLIHYLEENAVFAGDDLMTGIYPWGGDPSASPYDWVNAMNKLLELKPKIIIPGHGPVMHDLKTVEIFKTYFNKVIDLGEKLIKENAEEGTALEQLNGIGDLDSGKQIERKENTLKHMYNVMISKNT